MSFKEFLHKIRLRTARNFFAFPSKKKLMLVPLFTTRNQRLDRALDEVCNLAIKKGLKFKRPEIRIVSRGIGEVKRLRKSRQIVARTGGVAIGGKLILIFSRYVDKLHDMELSVLIAHELGHIIDSQTKRIGHSLFDAVKHLELDDEDFADAVAAYLYSKWVLIAVAKKCNAPINESLILRLNLNV